MKGNQTSNSSRHLRLDEDDRDMLLYGREMLVQFTVLTLGVDEKTLPECPMQIVNNEMKESHTDDNAKLVDATVKSDGMHSETVGSAPTVLENAATQKVSTSAQNKTIGEHSVSNVVSDKTDGVAAASLQDEQAIEPPRIETQVAHTSLPAAAAESPLTDIQIVKEVEKPLRTHKEERTPENNVISADEMMTNLLDEIEAELNDDFFSTTAEESTTAQEAVASMSSDTKIASENSINASPKEEPILVRSSESISKIEEEESDDLAMAIAMSLSAPDSDKDENEGNRIEDDGNRSNNKSLPKHEEDVTASFQQNDPEPPTPTLERTVAQPSDKDKPLLNGASSLVKQENGIHDKEVESHPVTTDDSNAHDKVDDSCKESDEVKEKQHVSSVQSDSESNKESTLGGTSHKGSQLSDHMNDRTSALRTSMSSVKTLQIRNTSVQPQDGNNEVATAVKENESTTKVDRPQAAAAGGHISQSHDVQSDYTNIFRKISIPEGEYASSNDEEAEIFRLGFELCHRSLFSIWPANELASVSGVSNLQQWRNDGPSSTNDHDPAILIPLHLVYVVWTYILGLQSKTLPHSTNDDRQAQSGSMYSWIVSNNKELSSVDDLPIRKLSMNIHTNLSETNISVCNYVLNTLRGIDVIGVYGGKVIDSPPSDTTFFIGVERSVCEEYTNNHRASSLLSEPIVRECHGILTQVVYPLVLDQLDDDDTAAKINCDQTLLWYALHHAPRHLMTVPRISDAKVMLLNSNFIRARVHSMGYLEGTKQHCKDCADLAHCLSRSENDWKRTQLHSADTKQEEYAMSPDDYDYHDCSQQAPKLPEWTESRVRALCAVSNILREKAGQISESNKDAKVEVGNSLQAVGEAIGDIGIYCVEELEQYDEALQLKSDALGDKHEEVAETLFAMGCHHQRFQHSAFAQRCYEQALAIYKARLGYNDPRVSRVLHNIGVMYHSKNQSSVAMKCFTKSLSIRKTTLGDNDISVAESLCWIGKIHRENDEFEAARESFLAAHRIKSLALGNNHSECAEILHNIGVVCDDLGLYSESLSSFREALVIRKANVSSAYDVNEMSDICDTLNCIANVYRAKMDRQRALKFFEQSLNKRARIVSATLSDDEQVPILLSTYEDVIALMKVELKESTDKREITEKIGSLLVEMAMLYDHRLNKPRKALTYFQRALQVFKQLKDLKKIGQVLSHMASIHVKNADNQKALKCFRDALVLEKKSLKGESLEMADTLHNIGNCEAKEGEYEKCLDTYSESLRIKTSILPMEHASIAKTEHCIGLAQMQAGYLEKALGYFLSSIKARRSLLGNDHLDVSFSLHR